MIIINSGNSNSSIIPAFEVQKYLHGFKVHCTVKPLRAFISLRTFTWNEISRSGARENALPIDESPETRNVARRHVYVYVSLFKIRGKTKITKWVCSVQFVLKSRHSQKTVVIERCFHCMRRTFFVVQNVALWSASQSKLFTIESSTVHRASFS